MSCLVTGSNGFIGSAVVARLRAHGQRGIRCLVRPGSDQARLRAALRDRGAYVVEGNLSSVDAADEALSDASCVYHLAAGLRGSVPELIADTVVTSRNLLEAARQRQQPPRIVLVSSFSVYGIADLRAGAVVDESVPLETHPERRDPYAFAKHRQERLFQSYADRYGLPIVTMRPGAVYGPTGSVLSSRVGLTIGPLFFHLGGDNLLPLSYVDNCAEAIALAGLRPQAVGQAYNVHDDDLPTAREYLRAYRSWVGGQPSVVVPYPLLRLGSKLVQAYHRHSEGQLPDILTPYKTASTYKPQQYDNGKLKHHLWWRQLVSTSVGMRRTFEALANTPRAVA